VNQPLADANTLFGFWPSRRADLSLSALKQVLEQNQVTFACTLSTVGIFYDFVEGNRRTLQACADNPILLPVGTVDPRRHFGCAAEIAGAHARGLRMFSLFPETQGWSLGVYCFREVAEALSREGLPLMVECSAPGAATEVLRAAEGLDLPVILSGADHGNLAEAMAVMRRRPRTYLETHALASAGGLEAVATEIGPDRLIFGSRSPLHYFSSAYLRLKYAGLDSQASAAARGGNLAALLGVGDANH